MELIDLSVIFASLSCSGISFSIVIVGFAASICPRTIFLISIHKYNFDGYLEFPLVGGCLSCHAFIKLRSKRTFLPNFLFLTKKLKHGAFRESCLGTGFRMIYCEAISNMPPLRMETSTVEPLNSGRVKLGEDIVPFVLQNAVQDFGFGHLKLGQSFSFNLQMTAQSCTLQVSCNPPLPHQYLNCAHLSMVWKFGKCIH
jgi:hypothetical protein